MIRVDGRPIRSAQKRMYSAVNRRHQMRCIACRGRHTKLRCIALNEIKLDSLVLGDFIWHSANTSTSGNSNRFSVMTCTQRDVSRRSRWVPLPVVADPVSVSTHTVRSPGMFLIEFLNLSSLRYRRCVLWTIWRALFLSNQVGESITVCSCVQWATRNWPTARFETVANASNDSIAFLCVSQPAIKRTFDRTRNQRNRSVLPVLWMGHIAGHIRHSDLSQYASPVWERSICEEAQTFL